VTRVQAAIILHRYATEFHEDYGMAFDAEALDSLTRRLAWYIEGEVDETYLSDYIGTLNELAQLEAGTHPGIEVNRARTVDNRGELHDVLEAELHAGLNDILDWARYRGPWVRPDGTVIHHPKHPKAA
jgi:hypothetical protein